MKQHAPITHIGYVVSDLEEAVNYWSTMLGARPFFIIPNIEFDVLTHHNEPAVFDHSAALGQWGSIAIELMQIHLVGPAEGDRRSAPGRLPVINYVAYLSSTPQKDGTTRRRRLRLLPLRQSWRDAIPLA